MLDKFNSEAQKYIQIAEALSFELKHSLCGGEHLLLAFLKNEESIYFKELSKFGLRYDKVLAFVKKAYPFDKDGHLFVQYTLDLRDILDKARIISSKKKEGLISSVSLFSSLLDSKSLSGDILDNYKVNKEKVIANVIKNQSKKSELDNIVDLHLLGIDEIDPLIGRENELNLLINALSRRNKPNAILIGEPGVGKTAIIETLAKMLLNNQVPSLIGKRIYELDIASTVSGTKYRGEFEEKVKKIIKKTKEDEKAILFVDEIHTIVKAGGAEGAIDASNILKPYLARGEIQLIGATTEEEFNQTFEKDKALKRRFQIIQINEPSLEETKNILLKIKSIYENHYCINISEDIIEYILEVSSKYILNEKFPDKAIDLLDNSCVLANDSLKKSNVDGVMSSYYNVNIDEKKEDKKERILEKVIGQDEAIEKICSYLSIKDIRVSEENKPKCSILIHGPSGVGKTYLSKLIAKEYYKYGFYLHIDLSSYSDYSSLSRLIGGNSSFFEGQSPFVRQIKNKPNSLVIFDNVDKASKDVQMFFVEILDNGFFFDYKGNQINCLNTSFIFIYSDLDEFSFCFSNRLTDQSKLKEYDCIIKNKVDIAVKFNYLDRDNIIKIGEKILKNKENACEEEFAFLEGELSIDSKKTIEKEGARLVYKHLRSINSKNIKKKELFSQK